MIENNFNKPVKNLDNNTSENKNEGAVERDWANLSSKDLMDLLEKLESFEDDEENLKQIPELIVEGKLEKDTFAALMIYKAPVYIIANKDSANKIINFLSELNAKLKNDTLKSTIEHLISESEYLVTSSEISEKAFKDLEDSVTKDDTETDFENLKNKIDTQHNATQANMLRFTAGRLFMEKVSKTYDALWKEYLETKEYTPKSYIK